MYRRTCGSLTPVTAFSIFYLLDGAKKLVRLSFSIAVCVPGGEIHRSGCGKNGFGVFLVGADPWPVFYLCAAWRLKNQQVASRAASR